MKHLLTILATASVLATSCAARPFTDPRAERSDAIDQAAALEPRDPACQARTLVAAGGAFPRNPHPLAVRWVGFSNFELVYNGRIILLDVDDLDARDGFGRAVSAAVMPSSLAARSAS